MHKHLEASTKTKELEKKASEKKATDEAAEREAVAAAAKRAGDLLSLERIDEKEPLPGFKSAPPKHLINFDFTDATSERLLTVKNYGIDKSEMPWVIKSGEKEIFKVTETGIEVSPENFEAALIHLKEYAEANNIDPSSLTVYFHSETEGHSEAMQAAMKKVFGDNPPKFQLCENRDEVAKNTIGGAGFRQDERTQLREESEPAMRRSPK